MGKFKLVKEKYLLLKVKEGNIDYAIDAIKYGTARHIIINDLIASYRGMELGLANTMMNDLYEAYGGEFKKENRRGYIYGLLFFLTSIVITFYIYNEKGPVSLNAYIIDGVCAILGVLSFSMALFGKFREEKVNKYSSILKKE